MNLFNSLGREVRLFGLGNAPVGLEVDDPLVLEVDAGELILRISSFESRDGTRTV